MHGNKSLTSAMAALLLASTACGDGDGAAHPGKAVPDAGPPVVVLDLQERVQHAAEIVDEGVEAVSGGFSEAVGAARDGIDTTVDAARARSAEVELAARAAEAEATAAAAGAVEDVTSRAAEGDARATGHP